MPRDQQTRSATLAFDHRVNDGADAARFVARVMDLLADPEQFMVAAQDATNTAEDAMGFDKQQIEAAALELLQEMESDPADAHEIQLRVRRLLDRMRSTGMPVPEDLARLEQELSQEFERDAERGGTKPE